MRHHTEENTSHFQEPEQVCPSHGYQRREGFNESTAGDIKTKKWNATRKLLC